MIAALERRRRWAHERGWCKELLARVAVRAMGTRDVAAVHPAIEMTALSFCSSSHWISLSLLPEYSIL
jgi:hypothetical protein